MKGALGLLIALQILFLRPASAADLQSLCHPVQEVHYSDSRNDLAAAVGRFSAQYSKDAKTVALGSKIQAQLAAIPTEEIAESQWQPKAPLWLALADLRSEVIRILSVEQKQAPPLAKGLIGLVREYGTLAQRDSKRGEYFAAERKIFLLTETAKPIEACYHSATSSVVNGDDLLWLDELAPGVGVSQNIESAFIPFELPPDSGQFSKTMILSIHADPLAGLLNYAHERQHGCNALNTVGFMKRLKDAPENAREALIAEIDREKSVDELRAYSREKEFFKEVAQAAPHLMCNLPIISHGLFGKQLLTWGEAMAEQERLEAAGAWPAYLIDKLAKSGTVRRQDVFATLPTARDRSHLDPKVIESVRLAGFKLLDSS